MDIDYSSTICTEGSSNESGTKYQCLRCGMSENDLGIHNRKQIGRPNFSIEDSCYTVPAATEANESSGIQTYCLRECKFSPFFCPLLMLLLSTSHGWKYAPVFIHTAPKKLE